MVAIAIVDRDEEAAIDGSSSSLNSHGGYCESSRAIGSDLSFRIDIPARTVPGGAAEGNDLGAPASELAADGEGGEAAATPVALIAYERDNRAGETDEDATALLPKFRAFDDSRRMSNDVDEGAKEMEMQ